MNKMHPELQDFFLVKKKVRLIQQVLTVLSPLSFMQ